MKTKKIDFKQADFEQGCYYATIGNTWAENTVPSTHANHTKCIRSKNLIPIMSGRRIETTLPVSNVRFKLFEYDESEKCIGSQERTGGGPYDLKYNTCYVLIQLYKTDLSAFAPTNVENYVGGWLSMCERMIEFGKLADDSLFVKGRNFLLDTQNMTHNNELYGRFGVVHDTESLFNGCATMETNVAWQGYKINFKKIAERCGIRAGDNVTYSIWAKFQGVPTREKCNFIFCRTKDDGSSMPAPRVFDKPKDQIVSGSWFQVKATFTVTEDDLEVTNLRIESNYYDEDNTNRQVNSQVWFACPKLEYGTEATPYSPAPEDYVNRTCADYDLTV